GGAGELPWMFPAGATGVELTSGSRSPPTGGVWSAANRASTNGREFGSGSAVFPVGQRSPGEENDSTRGSSCGHEFSLVLQCPSRRSKAVSKGNSMKQKSGQPPFIFPWSPKKKPAFAGSGSDAPIRRKTQLGSEKYVAASEISSGERANRSPV